MLLLARQSVVAVVALLSALGFTVWVSGLVFRGSGLRGQLFASRSKSRFGVRVQRLGPWIKVVGLGLRSSTFLPFATAFFGLAFASACARGARTDLTVSISGSACRERESEGECEGQREREGEREKER